MDIAASMSTAKNVGAATAEERAAVEKEGFLKLLVAQLSKTLTACLRATALARYSAAGFRFWLNA